MKFQYNQKKCVWRRLEISKRRFFSKAKCDYIYSADADEVLDSANRQRFLQLKAALIPEVEIVQMWYVTPPEFNTTENFDKEYRPKLYKRLREFTWIDPIHETSLKVVCRMKAVMKASIRRPCAFCVKRCDWKGKKRLFLNAR